MKRRELLLLHCHEKNLIFSVMEEKPEFSTG